MTREPLERFDSPNLHDRRRELIAFADWLKQEYAQLIETSILLRKESKELRDESQTLRRAGVELERPRTDSPTDWPEIAAPEHQPA